MSTRVLRPVIAIAASVLLFSACGNKNKRSAVAPPAPTPLPHTNTPHGAKESTTTKHPPLAPLPVGYTEEGIASWYGIPYHLRKAADGETYDMETFVAAHRVMPFNTWLRVTNLANNKTVNVRIIDRGPFVDGRIIDLSKAAARQIDLLGPGIGRVRLEVIAAPADIPSDDYYAVQVGAFTVFENAEKLRAALEQRFGAAKLVPSLGATTRWRVLVGKEPTEEGAQRIAAALTAENHEAFVVRLDEKLPAPAPQPPPAVAESTTSTPPNSTTNKVWQDPATVTFDPRHPQ